MLLILRIKQRSAVLKRYPLAPNDSADREISTDGVDAIATANVMSAARKSFQVENARVRVTAKTWNLLECPRMKSCSEYQVSARMSTNRVHAQCCGEGVA